MNTLNAWSPRLLSLLRVIAGLLFMEHGLQQIFHFPPALASAMAGAHGPPGHGAVGGLPPMIVGASWIEIIGGLLIVLGLFSRLAAFICSGEMAFAYFIAHYPRSVFPINNGGDAAILYCFIFFYLVFSGPGSVSLDYLLNKRID